MTFFQKRFLAYSVWPPNSCSFLIIVYTSLWRKASKRRSWIWPGNTYSQDFFENFRVTNCYKKVLEKCDKTRGVPHKTVNFAWTSFHAAQENCVPYIGSFLGEFDPDLVGFTKTCLLLPGVYCCYELIWL